MTNRIHQPQTSIKADQLASGKATQTINSPMDFGRALEAIKHIEYPDGNIRHSDGSISLPSNTETDDFPLGEACPFSPNDESCESCQ